MKQHSSRYRFRVFGDVCLKLLVLMALCAACTPKVSPLERVQSLALKSGFEFGMVETDEFDLATYMRLEPGADTLAIYIEGDGQAWRSRSRPSFDPSPNNPLGFMLAKLDPSPSVAYIARPCQFTGGVDGRNCDISDWTSHRFGRDSIESVNEAVSHMKRLAGADRIHLVGYSGGGAVALLVAGMRDDVLSVRTVAGNIDHEKWTSLHGVTPLSGSLNPQAQATGLCGVPQLHYVGGKDSIMPVDVARSYQKAAGASCPVTVEVLPGCTHSQGWAEAWPELGSSFYRQF